MITIEVKRYTDSKIGVFVKEDGELHATYQLVKGDDGDVFGVLTGQNSMTHARNMAFLLKLRELGFKTLTFESAPGQRVARSTKHIGTNPMTGVKKHRVYLDEIDQWL